MKYWKNRALSSVLAGTMLFAAAACGNNETLGAAKPGSTTAPGQTTQSADPVVFNIYKSGSWPAFPSDGGTGHQLLLDTMEKYGLTGIDFTVTHISGEEYFNKLNALAAIDDLPDYFSNNMVNLKNFADQDLLLPLEEQLVNLPVASKMMREKDINALTYDGHLYALPVAYLEGPSNGPNTTGFVIRQDWLDNVNLEVPETIEQLEDVLEAFTNQDPDQNGKDDTYGYIGIGTTEFDKIFGAFGVLPSFWMEGADGKVQLGATKPETLDALKLLADWYSKGYIDPDVFTNDQSLQDQKLANSKGGLYDGSAFTIDPANPEHAALVSLTATAKLVPAKPISGPNGEIGAYESSPAYGNINSVSADVENVDKLMQFLNWLTDDSENGGMYLASVGVKGEHFDLSDDGKHISMIKTYDDIYASGLGNPVRFLQVVDRRWMIPDAVNAFEVWDPMYKQNMFWGTTDSMLTYPDTSKNLFIRYMQKIVMGDLDAETGFQQYLAEFEDMGGLEITAEVNQVLGK